MIIVFILGYFLIGIILQIIGLMVSDRFLKIGFDGVDYALKGSIDNNNEEIVQHMRTLPYIALNTVGWPINVAFGIFIFIKYAKIYIDFKRR